MDHTLPMQKNLDKFRGCLIGGAAGDALGYAVEFLSERRIFASFGASGITEYAPRDGKARVSDDTQMTLFTANGLLLGTPESYTESIARAYREWYKTQFESFKNCNRRHTVCWLMNVPELFAARAPGNTCLSAIEDGCCGSIQHPANNSKGCGGVMRVAPIGLYSRMDAQDADLLGAKAAALTHGHEMGYIPAAMLVHIVRLLSHSDEITPKEAVLDSKAAMKLLFPGAGELPAFLELIDLAVSLSESGEPDLAAIHRLGEGWVGDEALAIAIYCALKYPRDFDKALIASVNHKGDSDSTGAITGNILGAYLGLAGIPKKYTDGLELVDVLTEMADDLYYDDPTRPDWEKKYVPQK